MKLKILFALSLSATALAQPALTTLVDETEVSSGSPLYYTSEEGDLAVTSLLGAIHRLGRTGDESAIVPLMGLEQRLRFASTADRSDLDQWAACVRALCSIRDRVPPDHANSITAALAYWVTALADPGSRRLATLAISIIEDTSAAAALVAQAFQGSVEATRALGALEDKTSMDGLALILTTRAQTWRVALRKLCEAGDERGRAAAEGLLVASGTPIGEVILAIRCLKAITPSEACAVALAGQVGHPVARVREEAARALIKAPHEAALPDLVRALEFDSFRLRLLALTAIARIDADVARSSLASIGQSHDDDQTREAARRLLEDPDENLMVEYHTEVEAERLGQHRILHAD